MKKCCSIFKFYSRYQIIWHENCYSIPRIYILRKIQPSSSDMLHKVGCMCVRAHMLWVFMCMVFLLKKIHKKSLTVHISHSRFQCTIVTILFLRLEYIRWGFGWLIWVACAPCVKYRPVCDWFTLGFLSTISTTKTSTMEQVCQKKTVHELGGLVCSRK